MPRQRTTIEVEAGANLVSDDHGQFAAGIEALDVLRGRGLDRQSKQERRDRSAAFSCCRIHGLSRAIARFQPERY